MMRMYVYPDIKARPTLQLWRIQRLIQYLQGGVPTIEKTRSCNFNIHYKRPQKNGNWGYNLLIMGYFPLCITGRGAHLVGNKSIDKAIYKGYNSIYDR